MNKPAHPQRMLSSLTMALGLLLASGQAAAAICHVDADASGANNGQNWTDAFTNLKVALGNANCTEIWVADGVYTPGAPDSESFTITAGIQVYGGFAGTETARTQRNPSAHITILSGDIDGDDTNTDGNHIAETTGDIQGDNTDHVVFIDGSSTPVTTATVLDGFVITPGQADGGSFEAYGGGLFCEGKNGGTCNPTLSGLRFVGNTALSGGAMYNDGFMGTSSPVLTNVSFSGNSTTADGGAMYNFGYEGTSSPELTNVTFSGNSAGGNGGAMSSDGRAGGISNPVLTNVTFSGNTATSMGGAFYTDGRGGTSNPELTNVTFTDNSAEFGGAIGNDCRFGGTCSTHLVNVILWDNHGSFGPNQITSLDAVPIVDHSIVQLGCRNFSVTTPRICSNIIETDPLLGALATTAVSPGRCCPAMAARRSTAAPAPTRPQATSAAFRGRRA